MQWTAPTRRHLGAKTVVLENDKSLLMATSGLSGHVASTSALPSEADIRVPMSFIGPISFAL